MKKDKSSEFLNYINKPLSEGVINQLYSNNNIMFERSQIYQDFILSLISLVCSTYMGDDITNENQKIAHFNWCWNKTVNNFGKEGIDFSGNVELYEYFLNFMIETFYTAKRKSDKLHLNLLKLWSYLFEIATPKTHSDIDSFVEVYGLFDASIKNMKKNNI